MKKLYSKKLLAMLSALLMTIGVFAAVPANAETTSILNENFDGTNYAPNRFVSLTVDDTKDAAYGKAIHFQTTGSDNAEDGTFRQLGHKFNSVQQGGTVIYSFDINAEAFNTSTVAGNYIDFTLFKDSPNTNWNNKTAYILRVGDPWCGGNVYALPTQPNSAVISSDVKAMNVKKWYRVDLVIDLDGSTISYYLDGSSWYTQEYKGEDGVLANSLGGIAIQRNKLYHNTSVYIDNINIRKVNSSMGDIKVETSTFSETGRYADIKFSETIRDSSDDLEHKIKVNNTKNNKGVEIEAVEKLTADTVRVSFEEGVLAASSEYKISFSNINNPFGGTADGSVIFSTSSTKNVSDVEDFNTGEIDTTSSLGYAVYQTKFGLAWGRSAAFTLEQGKTDESSDKALHIVSNGVLDNTPFRMNVAGTAAFDKSRVLGSVIYEFDFKVPSSTTKTNRDLTLTLDKSGGQILNVSGNAKTIYNPSSQPVASFTPDVWHNVKAEVDFVNNKIVYYLDDENVGEYVKDLSGFTDKMYDAYMNCGEQGADKSIDYTIDNFKISYKETATQGVGEADTIGIKDFAVSATDNGYKVSGVGVNTYDEDKNISLILCGYDTNGALVYAELDPNVALGKLRTNAISKEYTVDKTKIVSVKAYAWENAQSMIPCVMPAQYPNN